MKIVLKEAGGWTPSSSPTINFVDFDTIDQKSANDGRELVNNLLNSSPPSRSELHDRDAAEFTVSIERHGQTTVVTATSAGLSQEFAELLDWLKRHAGPSNAANTGEG